MKKEVDKARHQADTVAAAAVKGGDDDDDHNTQKVSFTARRGQPLPPQSCSSGGQPGATPGATAAVGASAELWRAESAGNALHSAKVEAALTEAEQRLAGVRLKAEASAGEAEDRLAEVRARGITRERNVGAYGELNSPVRWLFW